MHSIAALWTHRHLRVDVLEEEDASPLEHHKVAHGQGRRCWKSLRAPLLLQWTPCHRHRCGAMMSMTRSSGGAAERRRRWGEACGAASAEPSARNSPARCIAQPQRAAGERHTCAARVSGATPL